MGTGNEGPRTGLGEGKQEGRMLPRAMNGRHGDSYTERTRAVLLPQPRRDGGHFWRAQPCKRWWPEKGQHGHSADRHIAKAHRICIFSRRSPPPGTRMQRDSRIRALSTPTPLKSFPLQGQAARGPCSPRTVSETARTRKRHRRSCIPDFPNWASSRRVSSAPSTRRDFLKRKTLAL